MTTKVYSADPRQANRTLETFRRNLLQVQAKSSPSVGVVSNFDPDQRGFVTDTLKGYTMLQQQVGTSTVGRLAVHADFNRIPPGGKEPMRPEPGQPTLIYPVAGGTTSASLAFIKGGKADYVRTYPAKLLTRVTRSYTFGDTEVMGTNLFLPDGVVYARTAGDVDFLSLDSRLVWNENSPLPPGMRYLGFEDIAAHNMPPIEAGHNIALRLHNLGDISLDTYRFILIQINGIDPFTDFDLFLPADSQGNIRANRVPLPTNSFYYLAEELQKDKYWGGDASDPLNWQDDYWDGLDRDPTGNTPRVDRDLMKTWLTAHPGAVYTSG